MEDRDRKITSNGLAELIVDALVYANLIKKEDFKLAVEIAEEEIDVRKAAGDY